MITPHAYAAAEALFARFACRGIRGANSPQLYAQAEAELSAALAENPALAPALAELAAARSGEYHTHAADWQTLAIGAERVAQVAAGFSALPTLTAEQADAAAAKALADLDAVADEECPV